MDYTKYSWEELVAEITRLLEENSSHPSVWRDQTHSSTAQVLIQLMAAMTERLHYSLERRVQESYLSTAKLKSSIYAIAGSLGYRANRKTPSSGYIQLILDKKVLPGNTITIPPYTKITHNEQDLVTLKETKIHQGTDQVSLYVVEGVVEEIKIDISTGQIVNPTDREIVWDSGLLSVIIKDHSDIAEKTISIKTVSGGSTVDEYFDVMYKNPVTGEPPKGALSLSGKDDAVYDIRMSQYGMEILFGDGVFGKKPTGELVIRWVKTSGQNVSIPTTYTAAVDVVDNTTTSKALLEQSMTTTNVIDGQPLYDGMRILCNGFVSEPKRIYTLKKVVNVWTLIEPEDVNNRTMTYVKYGTDAGNVYMYQNGSWTIQAQPDQITITDFPVLQDNASPIPNSYQYNLQNTTPISGGLEEESIQSVKRYAPDWVKTGNRAVTKHDFRYYTLKSGIGGIVDAFAYGEEEIGINPKGWTSNNVWVTYLTKDKSELSTADKQKLMDWLNQYKQVTSIIILQAATRVLLSMKVFYKANPLLSISDQQTIEYIRDAISEYFSSTDGSIGKDAEHSELVQWIHNYEITDVGGIRKRLVDNVTIEVRLIQYKDFSGTSSLKTNIPVPVLKQTGVIKDYIVRGSMTMTDDSGNQIPSPNRAVVIFDSEKQLSSPTGLDINKTYETVITVSGTNHVISINGQNAQTFNGLLTELKTAIQNIPLNCTATLSGHIMLHIPNNEIQINEGGLSNPLFTSINGFEDIRSLVSTTESKDEPINDDFGMLNTTLINYRTGEMFVFNETLNLGKVVITYSQDDRQNTYAGPSQVLDVDTKTLQIIKV